MKSVVAALRTASFAGLLGLFATGLASCGQKGPLTLPQPPAGAASAPSPR